MDFETIISAVHGFFSPALVQLDDADKRLSRIERAVEEIAKKAGPDD